MKKREESGIGSIYSEMQSKVVSKIDDLDPIYEEFEGWVENINNLKDYSSLPNNLKKYIDFLENELNVPIKVISIGPDRNETIYR